MIDSTKYISDLFLWWEFSKCTRWLLWPVCVAKQIHHPKDVEASSKETQSRVNKKGANIRILWGEKRAPFHFASWPIMPSSMASANGSVGSNGMG